MIELPKKIFYTGVPGCKWSGISQIIEDLAGFNITDRSTSREFTSDNAYSARHTGAYFGPEMEYDAIPSHIYKAYKDPAAGCMLAKSHHWAYMLDELKDDWIIMIYRPDMVSFSWWMQVGGFNGIKYPKYTWYQNPEKMFYEIQEQNKALLKFAYENKLQWEGFTSEWLQKQFNTTVKNVIPVWDDVLVTIYKP